LKYDAGLSFSKLNFVSFLTLTGKGDTLKTSYLHTVSPLTKTIVGAEISHNFSRSENMFTIGTQHALDPLTTVKGRLNNYGKAAALLQHEWRPKIFVTLSGEVETKALYNSAKVGLSLILKP
jgi:voltage-dependent anion channel protein 2